MTDFGGNRNEFVGMDGGDGIGIHNPRRFKTHQANSPNGDNFTCMKVINNDGETIFTG